MSEFDVNFSVETQAEAYKRLAKGYRSRRNFLVAELLGMIVYSTPVKDGYARGGWYVSFSGTGNSGPRSPDKDGTATVFGALGALRGGSVFQDVWIRNDVPYIDDLERGSSAQAPDGMIRVNVSAFKSRYGDVI